MASKICSGCQIDTEIVVDHRAGSVLCSRCGLAFETNPFDEIPELRNSANSVENNNEIENPTSPTSSSNSNSNDPKTVKNVSSTRGSMIIETMADRLGLTTEIRDRTKEIYNEVDILGTCRGRSLHLIAAACIFLACKETGLPRTLNEISDAVGEGKKHINRTAESIKRQFDVESWMVQPEDYVQGYCSRVGLGKLAVRAVQEAVSRAQEIDIRRSPKSVLSAIIYMVIRLSSTQEKPPLPLKVIANAMEVTEVTIKKAFIDVSVFASKVIPAWYASEEDVKNIPNP